jgi:hypothetical protein
MKMYFSTKNSSCKRCTIRVIRVSWALLHNFKNNAEAKQATNGWMCFKLNLETQIGTQNIIPSKWT